MIFFELFYTFFLIGLFTFGGGYAMIPMIQDQIVGRGWMNDAQLSDFIAISESTPGPFAINISTFVGSRTAGIGGAICATVGVILPSFIIIILVSIILSKFLKNRFVQGGLNGVKPVILALIL
jgi:chromate transporter